MFKVGDEVYVKAQVVDIDVKTFEGYNHKVQFLDSINNEWDWVSQSAISDKTYEQGLADAWTLAKKILEMCGEKREEVLGLGSYANILEFVAPQEALAKIEAYEKEKSVCVGDVVEDEEGTKALVIDKGTENIYFVFTENGCVEEWYKRDLKKTGKKISIGDLLRQIGE